MSDMQPAAAYWHMASLVGKDYFLTPAPEVGVCMEVVGSDNIHTHWWLGSKPAGKIARAIRARKLPLRVLQSQPYDDRGKTT